MTKTGWSMLIPAMLIACGDTTESDMQGSQPTPATTVRDAAQSPDATRSVDAARPVQMLDAASPPAAPEDAGGASRGEDAATTWVDGGGVPSERIAVLVFTKTTGFRHPSIADGVTMIEQLAIANDFDMTHTEDAAMFNDVVLARYAAVVWLSTTGDVLDEPQQDAFERYVRGGGGYVGIHAAADTEYDWPFYGELLGNDAWFVAHPPQQTATVHVDTAAHVATAHYASTFSIHEEWYNFAANPSAVATVLMRVDESSYDPGPNAMGDDHPIAWLHEVDAGRAFYNAMGHPPETYADPDFRQHVLEAILWAAGLER